jgi:hypothetical protein
MVAVVKDLEERGFLQVSGVKFRISTPFASGSGSGFDLNQMILNQHPFWILFCVHIEALKYLKIKVDPRNRGPIR